MFAIGRDDEDGLVQVSEDGKLWKTLLDTIYPDRIPRQLDGLDFSEYEGLCFAADKYDMPSVLHNLRLRLRYTKYDPISVYVLACHLSWIDEAKSASTGSLKFKLNTPAAKEKLKHAMIEDVLRLFDLHSSRRDGLLAATRVSGPIWNTFQNKHQYCNFTSQVLDQWDALQLCLVTSMEKDSSGSKLVEALGGERYSPLWSRKCASCYRLCVDKEALARELQGVLNNLPNSVIF